MVITNAIQSHVCMDFMMNASVDITYHCGEIIVQCSTFCLFQQLLMSVYCACMEVYLLILHICHRLIVFLDLRISQIKDFYVIYYGQIQMILMGGAKMKEVFHLYLDQTSSKSFA